MDVFDFSGIYERMYKAGGYEDTRLIHVRDLSGTDGYLDDAAAGVLRERMRGAGVTCEGVHLIDNGNHHYMSALMTEMVEEDFVLLLLDHHPDLQPPAFGDLLSCGGWVAHALLHRPHMMRVVLAGTDPGLYEEALLMLQERLPAWEFEELTGRVLYLSEDQWTPEGVAAALDVRNENDDIREDTAGNFGRLPVYISVDKDVLSEEDVRTTWDQGTMRTEELTAILRAVTDRFLVIGADICGEVAPDAPEREVLRSREINMRIIHLLLR